MACTLSSCGALGLRCPKPCGILVPRPGIEPASPALEGRPPGKSWPRDLKAGIGRLCESAHGFHWLLRSSSDSTYLPTPWLFSPMASVYILLPSSPTLLFSSHLLSSTMSRSYMGSLRFFREAVSYPISKGRKILFLNISRWGAVLTANLGLCVLKACALFPLEFLQWGVL